MTIEITLNDTKYRIYQDSASFRISKFGLVTKEGSKNEGQVTERDLGLYPTSLTRAIMLIKREELISNEDVVVLEQYAAYIEQLNQQLDEQLKPLEVV